MILNSTPLLVLLKSNGPHFIPTYYLMIGLSTFNWPFIIWNSFMIFILKEFNAPYIMLHIGFKMHLVTYAGGFH